MTLFFMLHEEQQQRSDQHLLINAFTASWLDLVELCGVLVIEFRLRGQFKIVANFQFVNYFMLIL